MGFSDGGRGKEPDANAGNTRDMVSIPGWIDNLEKGSTTHC